MAARSTEKKQTFNDLLAVCKTRGDKVKKNYQYLISPNAKAALILGCPQLGWISLTTLQEVDIYQQMTVVTLVF